MSVDYEETRAQYEREVILPLIAELREAVDNEMKWTGKKQDSVKKIADKAEAANLCQPEETSRYLKDLFRRYKIDISDDTIEIVCGKDKKRKHKRYQELANPNVRVIDDKKIIEQTTTGQSNVRPYRPDKDVDAAVMREHDRDIEEMNLYSKSSNDEYTQQIHDLEQGREQDRETIKTMQKQIDTLKNENKNLERLANEAEIKRKATKQDFDKLVEKTEMLEKALKESSFSHASELPPSPKPAMAYVCAGDMLGHWSALRNAMAIAKATRRKSNAEDDNRRIILEQDQEGRIVHVRCEE
jgi:hypothetical protein